jgi:hypothetical protein
MNKNDMMALIRSVAVPTDVEEGMSHAYDLGVEWERARVEKILMAHGLSGDALMDILNGAQYP